jgi:hypothetical protein
MVSKGLIEEYLFDIFGLRFEYDYTISEHNLIIFKYKSLRIGYYNDKFTYGFDKNFKYSDEEIMYYKELFKKLEDMKVWLRKKKLERIDGLD